jgi:GT2 family glycosyltransferase
MDISFIIVNYESRQFLERCLASIRNHTPAATCEIILINNDALPLENLPDVKIIEAGSNGGFAKACNAGGREARGEFLFFLNPDTEILDFSFDSIAQALRNPAIGIAAPRLLTSSGAVQPWSIGYAITLLDTLRNNFGYIKSRRLWSETASGEVAWTSGAALAISKKLFAQCGGFDENFFMYFEDVDLCLRVQLSGKKIMLLPDIRIMHIGGQSVLDVKKQKQDYYRSQDYYFQKNFGTLPAFLIKFLRKTFLFLT